MWRYNQRPENVLKHAEDFIAIGKNKQALELLFNLLQQTAHGRGFRAFQPAHEDVMKRFIDLCVNSRNNNMAREGLHLYSRITINQAPNSHVNVIKYLLDAAEKKAEEAMSTCDARALEEVEDLESDRSPESILLEAVTSDRSKEQIERELLIPCVLFLWESYCSVLNNLKKSQSKTEELYHLTSHRAFEFCVKYNRRQEFYKLCRLLNRETKDRFKPDRRRHNVEPEEVGQASIEMYLASRFEQLKVASKLKMWNDGYRTMEDISELFGKTEKEISAQLWATLYQKVTELFLVAKNYLFHAHAYKAYFSLSQEYNKSLKPEQVRAMASGVLLSSMSVPLHTERAGVTADERENRQKKNQKMASLLGLSKVNPNRRDLLEELIGNDILETVLEPVRELYLHLECSFAPLDLVDRVVPLLNKIRDDKENTELHEYLEPLGTLLVIRVVAQLSQVFYSVTMDMLKETLAPLGRSWPDLERTIIHAIKLGQIDAYSVRFDHVAGCVRFSEDYIEEERTQRLLTDMSRGLNTICNQLEPKAKGKLKLAQRQERASTVLKFLGTTHQEVLRRKEIIDSRKAEYARLMQSRKDDAERRSKEAERQRKEAEKARVERQRKLQEQRALEQLDEEKRRFELKERLAVEGVVVDDKEIANLNQEERMKLLEDTRKKAMQESIEHAKKIEFNAKRLDTLTRAVREKEIPIRKANARKASAAEEEQFHKNWVEHLKRARVEHDEAVKAKAEYARMQDSRSGFEANLMARWTKEYETERAKRWRELDQRLKHAKLERARKLKARKAKEIQRQKDEEARIEREKRRIEEERERQRIQEEEEEAARKKMAESRSPRDGGDSRFSPRDPSPSRDKYRAARRTLDDDGPGERRPPRFENSRHDRDRPPRDGGFERSDDYPPSRDDRYGGGGSRDRGDRYGDRDGGRDRYGDRDGGRPSPFGDRRGGGGGGGRFGDRDRGDRFGDRDRGDRFGDRDRGDRYRPPREGGDDRFGRGGDRDRGDRFGDRGGDRGGDRDRDGGDRFGGDRRGGRSFGNPGASEGRWR